MQKVVSRLTQSKARKLVIVITKKPLTDKVSNFGRRNSSFKNEDKQTDIRSLSERKTLACKEAGVHKVGMFKANPNRKLSQSRKSCTQKRNTIRVLLERSSQVAGFVQKLMKHRKGNVSVEVGVLTKIGREVFSKL